MNRKAQGTSWGVIIFLSIYIILANASLISFSQSVSANPQRYNATGTDINYNSSSTASSEIQPIGFFQGLFITTTEVLPWYVTTFFIILPDVFIPLLIYMLLRGIW